MERTKPKYIIITPGHLWRERREESAQLGATTRGQVAIGPQGFYETETMFGIDSEQEFSEANTLEELDKCIEWGMKAYGQ